MTRSSGRIIGRSDRRPAAGQAGGRSRRADHSPIDLAMMVRITSLVPP